eukprot:NODE_38_length_2346_cov_874.875490_g33_i0.p1 GENE.NODE_38_length_2346_cov_874.875490_g33_i0~~NODE_38_length_2346_cov_874.875490_g33_i0.p1  ORF type:complete len:745 (-),score=260.26 NODE_38_length_2346_cov_874.875490_g33_i0:112-2241(-)
MSIGFLLLLACAFASAVEFTRFEGKTADPCNKWLDLDSNRDCRKHSQWPEPSVTILIPSIKSAGTTGTPSGTTLYARTLTMQGIGFPRPNKIVRLGLADPRDRCSNGVDAGVGGSLIPTLPATTNALGTEMTFKLAGGWDSLRLELESRPRLICYSDNGLRWRYTGFKIGVVWACDPSVDADINAKCGSDTLRKLSADWKDYTPLEKEQRIVRTTCCKSSLGTIQAGQCINPNVQACCGGAAYEIAHQKCCNPIKEWISQVDGHCPCTNNTDCPIGSLCCTPTKFSELRYNKTDTWPTHRGQCYIPSRESCCDTGSVYDPGSHQCCTINGVQSINEPCPCSTNAHCYGAQQPSSSRTFNHTCCAQTAPVPREFNTHCSIYANYPSGQATAQTQRCLGVCIDPNYQVCCNGRACIKDYERCCNSSCCNRWTSTCVHSYRAGAKGNRHNPLWYTTQDKPLVFDVCSSIEHLTSIRAFWAFVLPACLLLAAHIVLALVCIFAVKASPRTFSKLEYTMMGLALIVSYLAMPIFFSPAWKYAVFIILAQCFVFLAASARVRWLNVLCVIVQLFTLVYVFDPFHGNALLTLAVNRAEVSRGETTWNSEVAQSGLLHALTKSWHSLNLTASQRSCTQYYDWFELDAQARDVDRVDNPEILTFGYCTRGWVTALLFFAGFAMIGLLVQATVTLLGCFFRFHFGKYEEEDEEDFEEDY